MSILANSPHRELTETIIGGFFEMANELGPGYSERVNQRSLQIVLIGRGLDAKINVPIRVFFRGKLVGRFFADIVVNDTVLIEVKTLPTIDEAHAEKQILNYLRCAGGGIGFLVNFGKSVTFKRYAMGDLINCLPRLRERGSAPVGRRPAAAGGASRENKRPD
jgi:GxxExxY protein